MQKKIDWQGVSAPDLAAFEELAQAAWARMPETFRAPAGDLRIRVDDFATDEVLDSLGLDSGAIASLRERGAVA